MLWILEDQPMPITPQAEAFIRAILSQFCNSTISVPQCKTMLSPLVTRMGGIDRLHVILHCQEQLPQSEPAIISQSGTKKRSRPWTLTEDNRLLCAIHRYGLQAWPAVAAFVGNNRERTQCAQRWFRGLDPRICKDDWTEAEDLRLMQLVTQRPDAGWTRISREIGNRSDVQCRYRYLSLKRNGRGAALLAQIAPGGSREMTAEELALRQLAQLLGKKKGRPMNLQIPVGHEGGLGKRPPRRKKVETVVEEVVGKPRSESDPGDIFADWIGERQDETQEALMW
jgi:hypothetical protein